MPVTINGTTGIANVDGSAASPAFRNTDANSGIAGSSDQVVISTAGTERIRVASAGQVGIAGANYGTSGQVLTSGGASAAPSWAAASGGKVLQWKSITRDGNQRVTNNDNSTWTDGNIPLAITPASTSSRVLIILNLHVGLYYGTNGYQSKPGNNIGIQIYKTIGGSDTVIIDDDDDASGFYAFRMSQDSTTDQSDVWNFKTGFIPRTIIDHPNTTSEVTYKVAIKSGVTGNTVACNDSAHSSMVLLELENN